MLFVPFKFTKKEEHKAIKADSCDVFVIIVHRCNIIIGFHQLLVIYEFILCFYNYFYFLIKLVIELE